MIDVGAKEKRSGGSRTRELADLVPAVKQHFDAACSGHHGRQTSGRNRLAEKFDWRCVDDLL